MFKQLWLEIVLAALLIPGMLQAATERELLPPFSMGGMTFANVEIARTPEERTQGLMERSWIEPDGGMIFLSDEPEVRVIWMKNTRIPLDAVFIDGEHRIVSIAVMTPEKPRAIGESVDDYEARLPLYLSEGLALMTIEIRGGLAEVLGLKPGDYIQNLRIPAAASANITP